MLVLVAIVIPAELADMFETIMCKFVTALPGLI